MIRNRLTASDMASQEHLEYLDALRESGITKMYGARPYLAKEFGLSKANSAAILSEWMKTFGERKSAPKLVVEYPPQAKLRALGGL